MRILKRTGPEYHDRALWARTVHDLLLPCGSCLGCRKSRAREWAFRCHLELMQHPEACWTTLTYADAPPTLVKEHLSRFMHRLRKKMGAAGIRFFGCGEYGERTKRPHYHCVLFGVPPTSLAVQAAWPHGYAQVDRVSPGAISYVAGYCTKKITFKGEPYEFVDYETGELLTAQPEFLLMSRRPGIGSDARRHWRSWRDTAIREGIPQPVPRYLHASWRENASEEEVAALEAEKLELRRKLLTLNRHALAMSARRDRALQEQQSSKRTKL